MAAVRLGWFPLPVGPKELVEAARRLGHEVTVRLMDGQANCEVMVEDPDIRRIARLCPSCGQEVGALHDCCPRCDLAVEPRRVHLTEVVGSR